MHDWTCEYKQKFTAYRKERRREEGLRESGKAKAVYIQKEVTLNFFYSYCNKTRDLGGADAAMWYGCDAVIFCQRGIDESSPSSVLAGLRTPG